MSEIFGVPLLFVITNIVLGWVSSEPTENIVEPAGLCFALQDEYNFWLLLTGFQHSSFTVEALLL